jgi:hypothetical protein
MMYIFYVVMGFLVIVVVIGDKLSKKYISEVFKIQFVNLSLIRCLKTLKPFPVAHSYN